MVYQEFYLFGTGIQRHTKKFTVNKLSTFHPAFNNVGYERIAALYLSKWGHSSDAKQTLDKSLEAVKSQPICYDWAKSSESTPVTEHQAFQMVTGVCNEMTTLFDGLQIQLIDKKYNVNFSAEPMRSFYQRQGAIRLGPLKPHITIFINLFDPADEVNSIHRPLMTLETSPISSCFSAPAKVLFDTEIIDDIDKCLEKELKDLFKKTGAGDEGKTKCVNDVQDNFYKAYRVAIANAAAADTHLLGMTDGISLTIFRVLGSERHPIDNEPVHIIQGVRHVVEEPGLMLFRALLNFVWQIFEVVPQV